MFIIIRYIFSLIRVTIFSYYKVPNSNNYFKYKKCKYFLKITFIQKKLLKHAFI